MERGLLAGRRVILTRPESSSRTLSRLLTRGGANVVCAPLIRIDPPRSWKALDRGLRTLEGFDAVVFASANAVDSFFARARDLLERRPRPTRIVAAVGPKTARRLEAMGWRATIVPGEHRAQGLVKAMRLPAASRVLIPRAERGRDDLPRALRKSGCRVLAATAYRTRRDAVGRRRLRAELREGADVCCFASGSAVAAAFDYSPVRRAFGNCRTVAIGPTTAAALTARGLRPTVARGTDDKSFAAAVAASLRKSS